MKKYLALLFLPLALCLAACDGTVYYAEYEDVDENGWLPADSVAFDVNVEDTNLIFNFLVEVRNRDTMEYPLADPSGEWYGKRSGRYVDTRYFFRRNVRFPMQGNYHFAVTNGMRDSAIVGLSHIGFRIEYSNMNHPL